MASQSAVSKEAKEFIVEQIKEIGLVTVEEVAGKILPHYCFDPIKSKQREINNYARRLLASIRDSSGVRTVLAVKGSPGLYVDIDTCKDIPMLRNVDEQISDKLEGLKKDRKRLRRNIQQLEGQQSLFQIKSETREIDAAGG